MNTTPSSVKNGDLLIAEPFMGDTNFDRSVVLVCEHSQAGTFGLVLNQQTTIHLSDVIEEVHPDLPLFVGGPVMLAFLLVIQAGAKGSWTPNCNRKPGLSATSTLIFCSTRQQTNFGGAF